MEKQNALETVWAIHSLAGHSVLLVFKEFATCCGNYEVLQNSAVVDGLILHCYMIMEFLFFTIDLFNDTTVITLAWIGSLWSQGLCLLRSGFPSNTNSLTTIDPQTASVASLEVCPALPLVYKNTTEATLTSIAAVPLLCSGPPHIINILRLIFQRHN